MFKWNTVVEWTHPKDGESKHSTKGKMLCVDVKEKES